MFYVCDISIFDPAVVGAAALLSVKLETKTQTLATHFQYRYTSKVWAEGKEIEVIVHRNRNVKQEILAINVYRVLRECKDIFFQLMKRRGRMLKFSSTGEMAVKNNVTSVITII